MGFSVRVENQRSGPAQSFPNGGGDHAEPSQPLLEALDTTGQGSKQQARLAVP